MPYKKIYIVSLIGSVYLTNLRLNSGVLSQQTILNFSLILTINLLKEMKVKDCLRLFVES